MRIIFLDIDGVLNTAATKQRIPGEPYTGIDPRRVEALKTLVDQSNKIDETIIVLSSSWRVGVDRFGHEIPGHYAYLRECLAEQGLSIYDETPFLGDGSMRGKEIRFWIKDNWSLGITGIAILDDEAFDFKEKKVSRYWVRTSWFNANGGLQAGNVRQALRVMQMEIPAYFKYEG